MVVTLAATRDLLGRLQLPRAPTRDPRQTARLALLSQQGEQAIQGAVGQLLQEGLERHTF